MQTRREAAAKRVQELNISERSAFRYADSQNEQPESAPHEQLRGQAEHAHRRIGAGH